jgi:hypothetical protein
MSISGITGAPSMLRPQQMPSLTPSATTGTSAAATPAQQIATGNHHHRPPINGVGSGQAPGAGQPATGDAPGSAGVNMLA